MTEEQARTAFDELEAITDGEGSRLYVALQGGMRPAEAPGPRFTDIDQLDADHDAGNVERWWTVRVRPRTEDDGSLGSFTVDELLLVAEIARRSEATATIEASSLPGLIID